MATPGEWWDDRTCFDMPPEFFQLHPIAGEKPSDKNARVARAKHVCNNGCRVRQQCFEYALQTNDQGMVMGGMDYEERKRHSAA